MYLLRIAFRNLFRRRKRTLIIASILSLAVITFLLLDSFMMGMMDLSFGNVIDFETPHIEIARENFFAEADAKQELPLAETFSPSQDILAELKASQGFSALTPVLDFSANFIAGREEFPVLVRSIEPTTFGEVFKNEDYLVAGEFVEAGDSGVVIGSQLAKFFNLEVGDFYTLRFRDKQDYFSTIEGEVKGIVSTPHPEMNLGTVLVARDYAVKYLGVSEDQVSQLMLRMDNRNIALSQADKLGDKLADSAYEVRSYRDASEMLTSLEAWGYLETYFILALILLVGAIGIINAIVLSALERVKEIGMMKAMGLKESQIVQVFVLEAGGLGVIGGLIGCTVAAIVNALFATFGIDVESFWDVAELGLPMSGRIYGVWNPSSFVMIFLFVIVIAVVASIIPSYWAARKDPVEAIHHR
ncbi:ABC transporter permease [Fuchsiella alkaliacetigena]|uniref:ABC transporter permease n=1 Tax=Fuchsiella alkaliacetigena TaxID=957042 RepID=UPI00200A4117|nr:FtsX-like permease family protein [Fuchsiella alkaliacetigena]MCK8824144.1 FtsX-like permease family protein [Fuchsiella alkaliacetigena]